MQERLWGGVLLIRFPSPAYTWAQVKALGGGGGARFREPPVFPAPPQVWTGRGGRGRAPGWEDAAAPASLPRPLLPLRPGSPAPSLRQPRPHKS